MVLLFILVKEGVGAARHSLQGICFLKLKSITYIPAASEPILYRAGIALVGEETYGSSSSVSFRTDNNTLWFSLSSYPILALKDNQFSTVSLSYLKSPSQNSLKSWSEIGYLCRWNTAQLMHITRIICRYSGHGVWVINWMPTSAKSSAKLSRHQAIIVAYRWLTITSLKLLR